MPTIESKQIDITAEILGEPNKAVLLSDGKRQVWLPKNLIEYDEDAMIATMLEWFGRGK
jgi:hypothetical protein